jgi:prolyl-tRNA editing enzyme YbaK/EbsC (Cys-tRNA(Pro) deacylase)
MHEQIERIQSFIDLKKLDVQIRLLEPEATKTSDLAARSLGCTIAEIAKTIGFTTQQEAHPVLVVLSGDKLVSTSKLSKQVGIGVRKMNANEVREQTGYSIGGVPPFPHFEYVTVLADQSLFRFTDVWAAAGASNAVMKLNPGILLQMNIRKVDVSE